MRLYTTWFLLLLIPALVACAAFPIERRAWYEEIAAHVKSAFWIPETKVLSSPKDRIHGVYYTGSMDKDNLPPSVLIKYNISNVQQPVFALAPGGYLVLSIPESVAKSHSDIAQTKVELDRYILSDHTPSKRTLPFDPVREVPTRPLPFDPVRDDSAHTGTSTLPSNPVRDECGSEKTIHHETKKQTLSSALEELERNGGAILKNGKGFVNILTRGSRTKRQSYKFFNWDLKRMKVLKEDLKEYSAVVPEAQSPEESYYFLLEYDQDGPTVSISGSHLVYPEGGSIENQILVSNEK